MQQPATGMDSERCGFCKEPASLKTPTGRKHRQICLDRECKLIGDQPLAKAIEDKSIIVETRGEFLGSRVFAIDLNLCNSSPDALRTQVMWRIWHILEPHMAPGQRFDLEAKVNKKIELYNFNGMLLNAGDVVWVMVVGDELVAAPIITSFVSDASASVDAYGAADHYDKRQNTVAYIISEFIDNSLMAAINMDVGIPTIKVWILVSDDGEHMAIAIEVSAGTL